MYSNPIYNNTIDYRGVSPLLSSSRNLPTLLAATTKPKLGILSKLTSGTSLTSLSGILQKTSKVLNAYNRVVPIIKESKPMIDNIKTTIKVAKVFKRFNKSGGLEDAFDNLPDFKEEVKEDKKIVKEDVIDVVDNVKAEESNIFMSNDFQQKEVSAPLINVL